MIRGHCISRVQDGTLRVGSLRQCSRGFLNLTLDRARTGDPMRPRLGQLERRTRVLWAAPAGRVRSVRFADLTQAGGVGHQLMLPGALDRF
jgi:hypothetical protein